MAANISSHPHHLVIRRDIIEVPGDENVVWTELCNLENMLVLHCKYIAHTFVNNLYILELLNKSFNRK